MRNKTGFIIFFLTAMAVLATLALVEPSWAGKLEEAIAKTPVGTGPGMIHPDMPKGFMGIPGAPHSFWLFYILWGIWVGWIFSSVGAFGGIMAGVGHITVFGLADYGRTFKQTSPPLNKLLTDSIRVSQPVPGGPVGLYLLLDLLSHGPVGAAVGALPGCRRHSGRLPDSGVDRGQDQSQQYIGYFGIVVFAVAFVLFYETTPAGQAKKKAAKAAAKAFEDINIRKCAVDETGAQACGVQVTHWGITKIAFTFYGQEFSFNPLWPVLGGFVIAAISAFIGVGGGFLYVPFLTSVAGLPMFIVAGTSALAVLVSMITSIFTYHVRQERARGLRHDRHRTDRHRHRFHPGPGHFQVYPGNLAETHLRGPGGLRGPRLPDQGLPGSFHPAGDVICPEAQDPGAG